MGELFRLHLLMCGNCRRYLRSFRSSKELGRAAFEHPEGALPERVPEDRVSAVLASLLRRQ